MHANGLDDQPLVFEQVRKSVSVDINYGIRFNDDVEVKRFLMQICEELSRRLIEIDKKGKCITLKIMMRAKDAPTVSKKFMGFGEADKCSKSAQLVQFTNDPVTIFNSSANLLSALNIPAHDLRGIGVQISKLDDLDKNKSDGKLLEMFKKMSENADTKKTTPAVKLKPIVKVNKSPDKKRKRGVERTKSSGNLTSIASMFAVQKSSAKRKAIDPDVLAELPPDIVEEILREYEMEEVPEEGPQEEPKIEIKSEDSSSNLFLEQEWRRNVKDWIDFKREEISDEVEKIKNSLTHLVRVKNLELLFLVMRFLHRVIGDSESQCKDLWKDAYQNIFYENLQNEMRNVFHRKLSAPYEF